MSLVSVADALARLFALVRPMPAETVPIAEAAGRVLAEDAVARRDQPPFAASAMDGYALRAGEAAAGARLRLVGEAAAGRAHPGPLPAGAAIRIFTGAPLPEGADTVLIQENAEAGGGTLIVCEAPAEGAHIRPARADFAAGDRLAAPRRLTPRDVALLAAMNVARVRVARRPEVALIPTGDELVRPGETPGPDQIVASNDLGLAAMLAAIGARPRPCPIARDTRDSLVAALGIARGADMIVTIGGASVGERDLVASVLGAEGLALAVHRVAMRPGKPLMTGRLGESLMLGLPGNPVSAMVCGEIFLRPAVEAALGLPARPRARISLPLVAPLPANGPREHYMRATREAAGLRACPDQDSALLSVLARADALLVRPPHDPPRAAGERVEAVPLDGG